MGAHYVNNKLMYELLIQYRKDIELAIMEGRQKPRIPDYICLCFLSIANKVATKRNFVSYSSSWKEEMVLDAIELCVRYVETFDPDKSSNPFSYFTQTVHNAFIRRISIEKKETMYKAMLMLRNDIEGFSISDCDGIDTEDFSNIIDSAKSKLDFSLPIVSNTKKNTSYKKKEKPNLGSIIIRES